MKCPECSKPAEVVETRHRGNYVRRRYQCFNEHRFSTIEQVHQFHPGGGPQGGMSRELANARAADIHSCHDGCTRAGCVAARLRERVKVLEDALTHISLCSQNSASSKEECGRIARAIEQAHGIGRAA